MTCGVMMFYYAQDTRPITDYKRACERSSGAAAPHPAGCAVTELRAAGSRLAQAHTKCAINTLSATMAVTANFANASNMSKRLHDNKLKRSIINYRVVYEFEVTSTQDSTLPQVMPPDCGAVTRGGFSKGDTLSCLYPPLT